MARSPFLQASFRPLIAIFAPQSGGNARKSCLNLPLLAAAGTSRAMRPFISRSLS
jgi:hypothetical protein